MNDLSEFKIYSTSHDAWDAMFLAIKEAQKSIYLELFIFLDDDAGRPFFNLLEEKAKNGIEVKLVIDSFGSFWVPNRRVKSLKEAGADIRFFSERKLRYRGWWKMLWRRTHRKILIVDEKIGFVGGVNIEKKSEDWLDIQVRLEGKSVHSLLRAFAKNYIICGGEKKAVRHLLKYKFRLLSDRSEFIYDKPNKNRSIVGKKYVDALLRARERVTLFSPYYSPGKKFFWALWRARKKGIKVDLLIPFRTDLLLMKYVNYARFSLLKAIGVDVHLVDQMLHAKGMIVDDDWAMVGSSNIDQTSFHDNYEVNIGLREKMAIQNLREIIDGWLKKSHLLEDVEWERRGRWQKLMEWIAARLYQLWHYGRK